MVRKMEIQVKIVSCSKNQLTANLEKILQQVRSGYLEIGNTKTTLPSELDLKMELEERSDKTEFELELSWPSGGKIE